MITVLECIEEDPSHPMPEEALVRQWIDAALQSRRMSVGLSVCNQRPPAVQEMNHRYRGINQATNVLSFPIYEVMADHVYLGDIMCCGQQIVQEAREQQKDPLHHWAHLIIHSVLHLQGYTHDAEQDTARMEGLETQILESLGMPNPYAEDYQADQQG